MSRDGGPRPNDGGSSSLPISYNGAPLLGITATSKAIRGTACPPRVRWDFDVGRCTPVQIVISATRSSSDRIIFYWEWNVANVAWAFCIDLLK